MKKIRHLLNLILNEFSKKKELSHEELEKKAIEGAKKAVSDYRHVFERLAEYDRTPN